jgi:hypothetical protein
MIRYWNLLDFQVNLTLGSIMKVFGACILVFGAYSCLHAQDDIGRSEPPYVEATVTMPFKLINNKEKRCDMVSDLAEKSEMNYRLLGMKILEEWQSLIKSDKEFLKNLRQHKKVAFTVHKDGSIAIKGVDDAPGPDNKGRKNGSTKRTPSPAEANREN